MNMNSKTKSKQVADMFEQSAKGKHPYIAPRFEAIPIEQTHLICTSVTVKDGSNESDYEDKGDREGDDFEVDLGF